MERVAALFCACSAYFREAKKQKGRGESPGFFVFRFPKGNQQYFNPCQLYAFRAGPTSTILKRRLRLSTRLLYHGTQPIASVFLTRGSDSAARLPLLFLLLFCPGLLETVRVYINPNQSFLNRQHQEAVNK